MFNSPVRQLSAVIFSFVATSAFANTESARIDALEKQLKQQSEVLTTLQSELKSKESNETSAFENTSIGGYGEAQYYQFDNANKQYDAYRYVMYVGHKFSDTVRMHSELEIEHGLVADTDAKTCTIDATGKTATCKTSTKPGEVELEQMFLEWQYAPNHAVSFGQMLMPVGFINEFHEPETFYGTKRNPVETAIVPTTWWEGGVKASGMIDSNIGLGYDFMVSTGLKTADGSIRSGRQKGAKASAEALAYTARLRYNAGGLNAGVSVHHETDLTQKLSTLKNEATLIETHVGYNYQGLGLKALYAQWNIKGLVDTASAEKAKQSGYFVEANYRLAQPALDKLGVFARYSVWDNAQKANKLGVNNDSKLTQINYGFNYFMTPRAVLKVDIQTQTDKINDKDEDGFSLGIGYSF